MTESEAPDRAKLLETEIERRLSERFAALREEFDRLRLETDRRWFGFLEKFNQDLKGVVPTELIEPGPAPAGAAAAAKPASVGGRGGARSRPGRDPGRRASPLPRRVPQALLARRPARRARADRSARGRPSGFSAHGGDDDAVRQIALPLTEGGLLSRS